MSNTGNSGKSKVYVHRGRPRMTDKMTESKPFWTGKENYYTSVVMDRQQYEKVVKAAGERRCTIKEMMYRLIESSVAFDMPLYERLQALSSLSGKSIETCLTLVIKRGLEETNVK